MNLHTGEIYRIISAGSNGYLLNCIYIYLRDKFNLPQLAVIRELHALMGKWKTEEVKMRAGSDVVKLKSLW